MENSFEDRRVAVIGLGMEGKDLVNFLLKHKAEITVCDEKEEKELDFSGIDKTKLNILCGKNCLTNGLDDFEIIYRSPGVYRYRPELVKAEKAGVKISSAIKLFFDLCPAQIIGVTGTKGKGTTATLIYQIFRESGKKVYLAGNIGKPYLELLPKLTKNSWVVLELSSFQLIDLHKSPKLAVVLNITVDHLDWHKNKKEYIEAKANMVKYQKKQDFAIVNFDYTTSKNFERFTKGRVFYFSRKQKVKGSYVKAGKIILAMDREKTSLGNTDKLLLRGEHNWENITAAICASKLAGARISAIKKAIFNFPGLEHRLELVAKIKDITFYNDSFATSPQPTIAAINSFTEPVTVILGGYDKGLDYIGLGKNMVRRKNIKNIILIGDLTNKIKKTLRKAKFKERIVVMDKKNMSTIVKKAFSLSDKGGIVLLSPAAASFDMFKDYKDRGNQFKKAVKNLKLNTR